jgi:DNA-binding MarR family transcriptional regulator
VNETATSLRCFELLRKLHEVEEHLEAALEPVGLSLGKLGALAQLAMAGEPLPLSTLAEKCACVRSNITQLVDRLEAEKLVVRADDPHDRRSVRAELTPKGRARYTAALKAVEEAEKQLFSGLSGAKKDELLGLLAALRTTR